MGKHESKAWKFYKIKNGEIVRRKPKCPRCGSFMAEHKNRRHCGKCGYTEFTVS